MTPIKIEIEDGTYISQIFFEDGSVTTSANIGLTLFKEDGTSLNVTSRTPKTVTSDYKTIKALANSIGLTEYAGKTIKGAMLVKGTTAPTVYEQFIPNMPSPEYQSRKRNVGDNVNILDIYAKYQAGRAVTLNGVEITWLEGGALKLNGIATKNGSVAVNGVYQSNNSILKMNGTYNLSGLIAGTSMGFFYGTTQIAYFSKDSGAKIIDNKEIDYIIFSVTGGTTFNNDIIYLKLEQGTQATPWTPFGYGSADIKVQNKNLFNKDNVITGMVINRNTGIIDTSSAASKYSTSGFCRVKSNTQYYLGILHGSTNYGIVYYDKFRNYLSGAKLSNTFTTSNNCEYVRFTWITEDYDVNTIQLEKGSVATDYVPHEEQTLHFPLAKPLHKNDYLADDGIHYKRKTIVLDGTESWSNSVKEGNYQWFSRTGLSGIKVSEFICSHLKNYEVAGEYAGISSRRTPDRIYLCISESIDTRDKLKAYLAEQYANGTPVVVEYELAEEEIEAYTAEQQEAYNKLKELYSYEDMTHITCENDITCNFNVEHFKDYNILRQNDKQELQAQIDEIKASLVSEVSE